MLLYAQAKRVVREFGRDHLNGVYYRFPIFRDVYFGFIVCVRRRHVRSPARRRRYIIYILLYIPLRFRTNCNFVFVISSRKRSNTGNVPNSIWYPCIEFYQFYFSIIFICCFPTIAIIIIVQYMV